MLRGRPVGYSGLGVVPMGDLEILLVDAPVLVASLVPFPLAVPVPGGFFAFSLDDPLADGFWMALQDVLMSHAPTEISIWSRMNSLVSPLPIA